MKPLVLIGLPGSGKTTLGLLLAKALCRPFIDLDEVMNQVTGRTVQQIFTLRGETHFRTLETRILALALAQPDAVISTGGGIVLADENRRQLAAGGNVVFLDRPVADILGDIVLAHRPLLKDAPQRLYDLAQARRSLYEACADFCLKNTGTPAAALALLTAFDRGLRAPKYAVIGDPIHHSRSPALHRAAFHLQGRDDDYEAIQIPRGTLPAFFAGLRHSKLQGMNVTLPHKADVCALMDTLSQGAACAGAVNTVVRTGNRFHGHNTDMGGLSFALERAGDSFGGRNVVILGAGGAARGAAMQAALEGARHIRVLARDHEKATRLSAEVATSPGASCEGLLWEPKRLQRACLDCDLLINATPLGMTGYPADFESLTFLKALPPAALVFDLIYTPAETALLKQAAALGLRTLNGAGMLVAQALLAQELFLQSALPRQTMFSQLFDLMIATDPSKSLAIKKPPHKNTACMTER